MKNVPKLRFKEFSEYYILTNLTRLGEFRQSKPLSRNVEGDGEYKYIHYGDIHTKYKGILTNIDEIPSITESGEYDLIKNGDIIFADASEDYKDLGKTITISNVADEKLVSGLHTHLFRPNSRLNSNYFHYFTKTNIYLKEMSKRGNGISVLGISKNELKKVDVLLPSIAEQEKIANFLLRVDEKISLLEQKLILLSDYKLGVSQNIFILKGRQTKLKNLCNIVKGIQINGSELSESGKYYMLNGGATPSGYLDEWNRNENTISISEGGNSCGFVNFNETKFWSGGHCYTLEDVENVNNKYLYHYLKYNENRIMSLRVGSGLPNIQKKDLEKFQIILPSEELQIKICNILDSIDLKIKFLRLKKDNLVTIKKGLLQQMFV